VDTWFGREREFARERMRESNSKDKESYEVDGERLKGRACKWPKCLSGLPSFKTNSRWKLFVGVYQGSLLSCFSRLF
jgi:hypothetical protein